MKNNTHERAACLTDIIQTGRGKVRRSLESLVNRELITMAEARKVWRDAFGGKLIAVPASTIEVSLGQ